MTQAAPPIALFCFKRPIHLERTLEHLAANVGASGHELIAFVDGPRGVRDEDGCAAVRRMLEQWATRGRFLSFTIDAQPANLGLRRSIIRGVTRMCQEHGSVIVVEDDLETSPWFLAYMRDALALYADDPRVASIHGYSYPTRQGLPETYFLRGADCWGWGVWQRSWATYQDDAATLLARIAAQGLGRAFDHGGTRPHQNMLRDALDGRVDSWAIRWHASCFLAGTHTLFPGRSLVRNIGLDASGTHCGPDPGFDAGLSDRRILVSRQDVHEDPLAWEEVRRFFSYRDSMGWKAGQLWNRLWNKLRFLKQGTPGSSGNAGKGQ